MTLIWLLSNMALLDMKIVSLGEKTSPILYHVAPLLDYTKGAYLYFWFYICAKLSPKTEITSNGRGLFCKKQWILSATNGERKQSLVRIRSADTQ